MQQNNFGNLSETSGMFGSAPCASKNCNIWICENDAAIIRRVGFRVHAPFKT